MMLQYMHTHNGLGCILRVPYKNVRVTNAINYCALLSANLAFNPPSPPPPQHTNTGVLHGEEKDFKTGYSYFYEAFESLESIDSPKAVLALKYMLLCKIMLNT